MMLLTSGLTVKRISFHGNTAVNYYDYPCEGITTKSFVSACEAGSIQGDFNGHIVVQTDTIRFWFSSNMKDINYTFNCIIIK